MSGSNTMILRVQSPEGTHRVEASPEDATAALYERVHAALALGSYAFALHKDRQRRDELVSSKSRRLRDCGLRHGDMLYLSAVNGAVLFDQPAAAVEPVASEARTPAAVEPSTSREHAPAQLASQPASPPAAPQEDDVDIQLYNESGSIHRERDEKLCRHNSNGRCVHCSPLEPWDENYLKEHNIKHMSFHAYLRKIQTKGFVSLEEPSFKIKPGCTEHPPWPRGICSKCQPSGTTLARQPYRHVDNLVVEHPGVVERFLSYWRATGHQRLGLMFGRLERHDTVPLGVRARVAAIYEPPQRSDRDCIRLEPDPRAELVRQLAARLQLRPVGWIFTDLLPLDAAAGTVRRTRGVDTHFLSAQECITAAHYQNEHPSPCRHAASGYYGSKFVTVCVTGDSASRVHLEGYQVSEQAAALVRAGLVVPTRDAGELAHVAAGGARQYVPEVRHAARDAYGNEVPVRGGSLPVAYLLVDVPCGVVSGEARASLHPGAAFPPAHRALAHQLQTPAALHAALHARPALHAADLHLLLYVASNDALPLSLDEMQPLLDAVLAEDAAAAERWWLEPRPQTLRRLAEASAAPPAPGASDISDALSDDMWTCPLCTFHNLPRHLTCDMCAMPRHAGAP